MSPSAPPPLWARALAAAFGGGLTALAFPPAALAVAAVLGPALGLWAAGVASRPREGGLVGFAWGLGFGFALFTWALELHVAAYLALAPVQAVFFAVLGAGVAWLAPLGPGWWLVGTAGLWTLVEALRGRVPLGGFEWGQLGLALSDLPVRHAAAVLGALGATGLVAGVAAGLAGLARTPGAWRSAVALRGLGAAVVVLVGIALVGALPWTSPSGQLDVAIVQTDDPCPDAFSVDCPNVRERTQDGLLEEGEALSEAPELLLWGEGTLRGDDPDDAGRRVLERTGAELPAPLLAGITSPVPPDLFDNRNVLYTPEGEALSWYAKRHPVPFGEYVPFRDQLGWIGEVGRLVPRDMVRGDEPVPLAVPDTDAELGSVVSWEVTFARLVRDAALVGDAVATLTTQASYGTAPVSDQLLGAAQLRAVETGRAQIVAATTGRSSLIQPDGVPEGTTALFAADHLEGTVELREGRTPYLWWGDLGAVLLGAGAFGGAALARRRLPNDVPPAGG